MIDKKYDYEYINELLANLPDPIGQWAKVAEMYNALFPDSPITRTALRNIIFRNPWVADYKCVPDHTKNQRKLYDYGIIEGIVKRYPSILDEASNVIAYLYYLQTGNRIPRPAVHFYLKSHEQRLRRLMNGKEE